MEVCPGKSAVVLLNGESKAAADVPVDEVIVGPTGQHQQVARILCSHNAIGWTLVAYPEDDSVHGKQFVLTGALGLKRRCDVQIGDYLMTPQGTHKRVLSVVRGRGMVYRVYPTRGEMFYVHADQRIGLRVSSAFHHMPLKRDANGRVTTWKFMYYSPTEAQIKQKHISVPIGDDAAERDRRFVLWQVKNGVSPATHTTFSLTLDQFRAVGMRAQMTLRRAGAIERPQRQHAVEPMFIGLYHGDGLSGHPTLCIDARKKACITPYLEEMVARKGYVRISDAGDRLAVSVCGNGSAGRTLAAELTLLWPDGQKHFSEEYIDCPISDRLDYLAGIISTDGSLINNCYVIIQKREELATSIVRVARSVGLHAHVVIKYIKWTGAAGAYEGRSADAAWYYFVTLSGHTDKIPVLTPWKKATPRRQAKQPNNFGIDWTRNPPTPIGERAWVDFQLEDDAEYVGPDYTVFGSYK